MTDKKKLYEQLEKKVKKVYGALDEAKAFANEHGLSFDFRPAYAMGGTYYGSEDAFNEARDWNYNANDGWAPSSGSC